MGSATINLAAVIDTFGGTTAASLRFTAVVMRGGQPALRVSGAQATLPAPLAWYWTGSAWAAGAPALTDVDPDCYWLVELASTDGATRLTRAVVLPTGHGSAVDFGALITVDPKTLVPTPTVLQTWIDQALAAVAAQAVSDAATYLPFWKPNTAYVAGQRVVSPTGQTITANADFTSGASYVAGNWTVVAGGGGTVSDATTSAKGIVQLAGDLGGTAGAPTVPGLAAKAPLASPAFTGTPTVPTATAGTTTTQAASTAFVKAAIDALVAGAPGALDTLKEIADQLAADESGVATLTTLIAQRTMSAAPVTLTAAGTLTPNVQNLLDATAGAFTATLPTPARIGQLLVVERADTGTNLISIGGTVRGVTTGLPTLPGLAVAGESITFAAESLTSWRPIASHKPKALLDKQFDALGAATASTATATVATDAKLAALNTFASPRTSRNRTTMFKNATDAYNFPPRVRPPEPGRKRIVIRNDAATAVQLAFGTGDSSNYNNPGGSAFTITVPPRSEYVDMSERPIFARPAVTGNAVFLTVDTWIGVS